MLNLTLKVSRSLDSIGSYKEVTLYTQDDNLARVIDAYAFFIAEMTVAIGAVIPDRQNRIQLTTKLQSALESPPESFGYQERETVRILFDVLSNNLLSS